jgi:hypothetical protein
MRYDKRFYVYRPVGLDAWEGRAGRPAPGTVVVKCQPRSCPPNGTLRHCYIADAETGRFYGLVLEASLEPLRPPAGVAAGGGEPA